MTFDRITIVGLGLIGGSLASAFKRKDVKAQIVGVDDDAVVARGLEMRVIDRGFIKAELEQAVATADLVILATPILAITENLQKMSRALQPGTLITDVGSTKAHIVEMAERYLPDTVHFLGGHPMAGASSAGIDNADPFLFENAIYVLTESRDVPHKLKDNLVALLELIGAKTVFLAPDEHDRIAAMVSHLPQMMAVSLMNYAANFNESNPTVLKLAAGGFRDMTRIASSSFQIWRDILSTNRDNITRSIDGFIAALQGLRASMYEDSIEAEFQRAGRSRLAIPTDTRGFLMPHFDLYVIVEDKPGVIAAIATALAAENINIKDIEVVKVREGDAGTIRLAFENERERARATVLLQEKGFQTQKRD